MLDFVRGDRLFGEPILKLPARGRAAGQEEGKVKTPVSIDIFPSFSFKIPALQGIQANQRIRSDLYQDMRCRKATGLISLTGDNQIEALGTPC